MSSARRRIGPGTAGALLLGLVACGGETPAPTAPAPAPPPVPVTISVAPNPLRATQVTTSDGGVSYRFTADVSLTASAGSGARIVQLSTIVSSTHITPVGDFSSWLSASATVSIQMQPGSTTVHAHPQEIGGTFSGEKVTWRIEASGIDSQGRPFTASSAEIPIEFVTTTPTGS